jgi:hypothetical protein
MKVSDVISFTFKPFYSWGNIHQWAAAKAGPDALAN